MSLTQGQILKDRYRIVRLLGQGGFGAVYRAWDLTLNCPCALKESFEVSPEGQRQFMREAHILANLHHPSLPRVTNYFAIPGQGQYLVMDYVEGQDLEELRQQAGGRMPQAQVLDWIGQVCDALDYLHQQQPPVIHRDIKPGNIKVTPDNRAILVDFGLAKAYDPHTKTTVGARAVTLGYSPIEQYGKGVTDVRSDIYSVGATVYALLTGEEPPEAPERVVHDPLKPPLQLNPGIPAQVGAALVKALMIDPEKRFQRAGEFKAALQGQLPVVVGSRAPLVSVQPDSAVQAPAQPHISGRWVLLGVGFVFWLSVMVFLATGISGLLEERREAQATHAQATQMAYASTTQADANRRTRTASASDTQRAYATATQAFIERGTQTRQASQTWAVYAQQTTRAHATQVVQATQAGATQARQTSQAMSTQTYDLLTQLFPNDHLTTTLLIGPRSGELVHEDDDYVQAGYLQSRMVNFVLDVVFENPYSASFHSWDIGVLFRETEGNNQFRLIISPDYGWELRNMTGTGRYETIDQGYLDNLDVSESGQNHVLLVAYNEEGYLYLNDLLIAELDLSARLMEGDISIATGIYTGDEVSGEATGFHSLCLWGIRD